MNSYAYFMRRLMSPTKWTLKGRFLYLTGTLLLLGSIFQIFFLSYTLNSTITDRAADRLVLLEDEVLTALNVTEQSFRSQVQSLATLSNIRQALASQDRERLKNFIKAYADGARFSLEMNSLNFEFIVPPATTLLQTLNVKSLGDDYSSDRFFQTVTDKLTTVSGLVMTSEGLALRAAEPVLIDEAHIGTISMSTLVDDILKKYAPRTHGFQILLPSKAAKDKKAQPETLQAQSTFGGIKYFPPASQISEENIFEESDVFYKISKLKGMDGKPVAALITAFDSLLLRQIKRTRVMQLGSLFMSGAVLLWIFLYLNVTRIEIFLKRLKKIIIASHSNDFSERFESDHVHCLEVMHCHNEECPVFEDPARICYLETGSEAISPVWRDTCIFLNKYESCTNCPVYKLRRGDELAEMRNVVNTMMRLWSTFLSRTGHLLAYVLRSQESAGQLPSLDEVSNRLEQMAKLTFFSHDIQGTLDKDEVYQQLAFVFKTYFEVQNYVLFEVDNESDRIVIALDSHPTEALCKRNVLLSTEVCRAHRVAEDVISFYNPVLCPYFNCDLDQNVRCCMPIVMSGHVGAVFSFTLPKNKWEQIRAERMPIMRKYLDEAAPVLSSLRLLKLSKEQALRDPLTHCHNRRFLDEFISKYEPLSEREGRRTGFVMADVDYFKQVNDEYGHEAGDAVLLQVVGLIQTSIRRSDLLIRYGGEEFLILLQDVQPGMSEKVAEKIRSTIAQHHFEIPNGIKIQKTISLGVAEYPEDGNTLYKAIKFSDVALYAAKNSGRNKIIRFLPEMWADESY